MSVKEKLLRRILIDAEFFLNNIDGDDPYDPVGDAINAGQRNHHIDALVSDKNPEEYKKANAGVNEDDPGLGEDKFFELIAEAEEMLKANLFEKETFRILSRECTILYIELAIRSNRRDEQAEDILTFFFNHTTCEDQFYCRALLAQATVEFRKINKRLLKAEVNLEQTMKSWEYIQKALDIITRPENKSRYEFLIYNAAITTYQVLRPLNKPIWSQHFVAVLEKISNLLEEKEDADFNLRIRFLSCVSNAYLDAEKKAEGLKFHDKLYELTKKVKECSFQEVMIRNRIHIYRDNNGQLGTIKKDAETGSDPHNIKALCTIQQIKSECIPENQVEKELTSVMASLSPASVALVEGASGEGNEAQVNKKLSKYDQDRMAEAGRMAIQYDLIAL